MLGLGYGYVVRVFDEYPIWSEESREFKVIDGFYREQRVGKGRNEECVMQMYFALHIINNGEMFYGPFSNGIYAGFVSKVDRSRRGVGDVRDEIV